jgi:hypothetical protein
MLYRSTVFLPKIPLERVRHSFSVWKSLVRVNRSEVKPKVKQFFRFGWDYTPASCLSSWNLRSNQSLWPQASVADSRKGGWPGTVFSLKVSIKLRAICRSFVVRLHGLVNLSGQYRESLIWESVQFCTDISGLESSICTESKQNMKARDVAKNQGRREGPTGRVASGLIPALGEQAGLCVQPVVR